MKIQYALSNNRIIPFDASADKSPRIGGGEARFFAKREHLDLLLKKAASADLVKIHNENAPADVKPVKKFENRTIALDRIWKLAQGLAKEILTGDPSAPAATEAAPAAPKATEAAPKKGLEELAALAAPKAPKAPATEAAPKAPREGSKKAIALEMLRGGTTREEMQTALGWLPHTTRGFLSILGKTHPITTTKMEDGRRFYKLAE